jgi:PAS domain S-box-containing protein
MFKFPFGKSIKTELIVLMFGLTAVSIGVVGFLGVRGLLDSGQKAETITAESTEQRAEELLVQTTAATAEKNSLLLTSVQNEASTVATYTEQVFNNPSSFSSAWRFDDHVFRKPTGQWWNNPDELPNILLGNFITTPSASLKKEIELLHNLDFLAPQVLENHPNAVALYFIGALGESFYYPNIDLGSIIPPDLNPATLDFYTVATPEVNPDRTVQWTKVYDDPAGNGLTITASSPVYAPKDNFRGVMSIDVTLNNVAKSIEDYSPIESSYAFLIDNDGRAIALPVQGYKDILGRDAKKGEFGADLSKVSGDFGAVLKEMRGGKQGFAQVKASDTGLYVAYAPVADTPFSLAIVAKEGVLLKVVGDLQAQVARSTQQVLYFQILPIAAILLLLVWVLGFMYIRYLTAPIIALTAKTNTIMQGPQASLPEELDVKTSDNEVGKLAGAFNKMINELAASYKALERKVQELGDAKAKDDAILNGIGDGLVVTDASGEILLMNQIAAKLMGFEAGHQAGQKVTDRDLYDEGGKVIPAEQRPMMVALAKGEKVNRYALTKPQGDDKIMLNISASSVKENGQIIGAIEIIRDVTKEKEVDRMKSEFISVASHQLRTPLSAIKWFSGMLKRGDAGELQKEQAEFVENISGSTDRMIEIVDVLLNISRLEAGRIMVEPVPTDLRELVLGVVDGLKDRITEKKQHLEVEVEEGLPKINLDAGLVTQVYRNLLTNAYKYTPEGGHVTVTVKREGDHVISQVADTGYGVPEAEQEKMFKKFFRGTNVTKVETDGTGLGMYMTKAIVESSGGKIWFHSEEDHGTSFWFTLPLTGMKASENEEVPPDQD